MENLGHFVVGTVRKLIHIAHIALTILHSMTVKTKAFNCLITNCNYLLPITFPQ